MYKETKATTLQGNVIIENQSAVSMYAQKSNRGDLTINVNVQSETLYKANKEECDADIATFKAHAEEL
jgi:hypothetical protein